MSRQTAGDGQHGVLLGHDDAVLPEGAIAAVDAGRLAAPELEAVALRPIGIRVRAIVDLLGGGLLDPVRGDELLPLPLPLLQIELPEAGDIFGGDAQPPAAKVDAVGVALPGGALDAERLEQARGEVVEQGLPGQLLHDGGEHEAGRGVVDRNGCRGRAPPAAPGRL